MTAIRISITAFVDDDFPGWVEFEMTDANGVLHQFVEKGSVVSDEDLRVDSIYPRQGFIACEVISTWIDNDGRSISKVDTSKPWGVESRSGVTQFVVQSDCLQSTP